MRSVEPGVHLVGETALLRDGLQGYLEELGAGEWTSVDPPSEAEELIEVMGRGCYKSYGTHLNPNLTKVREGNEPYIKNIVGTHHGSVLEHASVSFMFTNVSRVFTHELVRHRVGVAISQESLRYVRLTDLGMWWPKCIRDNPDALEIMEDHVRQAENVQRNLARVFGLDREGVDFSTKKEITSAMRRVAPIGLATNMGWTANFRSLRWLLQLRTARGAEEEIRLVFSHVGDLLMQRYPNVFGDFVKQWPGDTHIPEFVPKAEKV